MAESREKSGYRRPPIIESTIEFRWSTPISFEATTKIAEKLRANYPIMDAEREFGAQLDTGGRTAKYNERMIGHQLSSLDQSELVLCRETILAIVQRAPYPGWESFLSRAKRDFQIWAKASGRPALVRLGVRFQNRLDIPVHGNVGFIPSDYVNVLPNTPLFGIDRVDSYHMRLVVPLAEDQARVIIITSLVPSPVPERSGLLLDLDLFRDVEIPQRQPDIWKALERMRNQKNAVFEACVTDKSRELFDT